MGSNGWDSKEAVRVTYRCPWKFTARCYEEFIKHVNFEVGKGDKIRFWEDPWLGVSLFAQRFLVLYRMSNTHNRSIYSLSSVENFIRNGGYSWNLSFIRNLNE